MQLPTHLLLGMIILLGLERLLNPLATGLIYITTAILAFLSHVLLDCIANSTYHPPEAHWDDWFWKIFHLGVYVGAAVIIVLWGRDYWWGMLWACMIDLWDWVIARGLLKKPPVFHPIIDQVRDAGFSWLPNLTEHKWAAIIEIGLDSLFLFCIWVLRT